MIRILLSTWAGNIGFLTDEIGIKALRQHLWQVIGIGLSVDAIAAFDKAFNRAPPVRKANYSHLRLDA